MKPKYNLIHTQIGLECKTVKNKDGSKLVLVWGWHPTLNAYMCSGCGEEFMMPMTREEIEELNKQWKKEREEEEMRFD